MALHYVLWIGILLACLSHLPEVKGSTYRAAVLEHELQGGYYSDLDAVIVENIRAYARNATDAAEKGADLIVFPEYGITGPGTATADRNLLATVAAQDDIPNPEDILWNPCDDSTVVFTNKTNILYGLSCMAQINSIAIAANLLSREICDDTQNTKCPEDKQFIYNTNVIFDKNGTLVGRYHKHHLFKEYSIDPGPESGITIVDLGFARFATITCYDIMFADPVIDYVKKHNVKNIIFPTNWIDTMPFMTSVQTFAGFAQGLGINLLAANLHLPKAGSMGSGIYSSHMGAMEEIYDLSTPAQLLIADVPIEPPVSAENKHNCDTSSTVKSIQHRFCQRKDFFTGSNVYMDGDSFKKTQLPAKTPVNDTYHMYWFMPIENSVYVFLEAESDDVSLCHNDVCCRVSYNISNRSSKVHYALSGFSGYLNSSEDLRLYQQGCSVLRCESRDGTSCGDVPTNDDNAQFSRLVLSGDFATDFLYPNVFSTNLKNINPKVWTFSKVSCSSSDEKCARTGASIQMDWVNYDPILTMRIFGRVYVRDFPKIETLELPYSGWYNNAFTVTHVSSMIICLNIIYFGLLIGA